VFKSGDAGDPMPWAAAVGLAWLLVGVGILLVWMGRRATAGLLERNWIMGIRTKSTLASDEAWEAAHRAAGGVLSLSGLGPLILGPLLLLRPNNAVGAGLVFLAIAWLLTGILIAGGRGRSAAQAAENDASKNA